jgi:hypothetical protein
MKNLELSDDEAQALVRVLGDAIDSDRYPLSPRTQVLRGILARLRPEPVRAAASPEPEGLCAAVEGAVSEAWVARTSNDPFRRAN